MVSDGGGGVYLDLLQIEFCVLGGHAVGFDCTFQKDVDADWG